MLAFLGSDAAVAEWSPVLRRLQATLPGHAPELIRLDHTGLREAARRGELATLGIDPEDELAELREVGLPMGGVVDALDAGLADAGVPRSCLLRLSVLGELSGTLAHELNQPLAAITNYASSLVRRADKQSLTEAAVREAAGEITGQAERAAAILGRIRAFARKRTASRERVAPRELVDEAVALFRGMLAQAPQVDVVDTLPADTRVELDALQIQQVLLNLLKNAWDASRGLPAARQRIRIRLERVGASLRIIVRDYGRGLDETARERLFESFFTTKADGLGLGLSICRRIAEAHGGRLSAGTAMAETSAGADEAIEPEAEAEAEGASFTLPLPLDGSAPETNDKRIPRT